MGKLVMAAVCFGFGIAYTAGGGFAEACAWQAGGAVLIALAIDSRSKGDRA